MLRWWRRLSVVLVLCAVLGVTVAAQGEGEFKPVQDSDLVRENIPFAPLLFGAYGTVWVVLLIYVFSLWRRIQKVERDLVDVTSKLEAGRP